VQSAARFKAQIDGLRADLQFACQSV
jgi:hypothetical protein